MERLLFGLCRSWKRDQESARMQRVRCEGIAWREKKEKKTPQCSFQDRKVMVLAIAFVHVQNVHTEREGIRKGSRNVYRKGGNS